MSSFTSSLLHISLCSPGTRKHGLNFPPQTALSFTTVHQCCNVATLPLPPPPPVLTDKLVKPGGRRRRERERRGDSGARRADAEAATRRSELRSSVALLCALPGLASYLSLLSHRKYFSLQKESAMVRFRADSLARNQLNKGTNIDMMNSITGIISTKRYRRLNP